MAIPHKILTRKDEITAKFFELLEKHMGEIMAGKVDKMYHIKDFAALLFIHPTHFSNTIKLTTGHSPCHFAEERTMDEARKMLSETPMSIAEISYKLTFNEPTNFTKFFKSFEGITPKQYRKQIIESETNTINSETSTIF
ncbi:helix-turn-helix domain-containing protein [Pedobacter sp. LMG 31464]|uniref:Helix-turn-helix domain-containing protein n=1 Tax=Pedobacter planticolens TaxID=2679964 RepID=A0A923E0H2_9SPHI|nr:AraC family transcriptional regulator [Pedobacter planticolens]MBB2146153.1 helix-turn-helix domain-containing protein [Pedobacter planticolens]